MRLSLSKAYAALLLGAVTLATIACGIGGGADEVERAPGRGQMESYGATDRAGDNRAATRFRSGPPPTAAPP